MQRFLRDNSKKVMALFSVVLMVLFFLPSLSGNNSSRNGDADRTVATVYGNEKISAYEQETAKQEWELVTRQLYYDRGNGDDQHAPIAEKLGQGAVAAIDNNPLSFLLLMKEAEHLGITVSNDQLQEAVKNQVANMPDPADDSYPRALSAVHDLLLVYNLLDRVSDVVKESGPRVIRNLALTQQDASLNVATIPLANYLAAATQPTREQLQTQFNLYSQTLAGTPTATNPLGFGYLYPNRVKVQYIGFNMQEIRRAVQASRPMIDWETQARRLYRTHTADFPIPTTNPATQPLASASTQPAWEDLPTDVVTQVYNKVYDIAQNEAAGKIRDAMNQQLEADWLAFHNAAAGGTALPTTSFGVTFDSDGYIPALATSLQNQFSAVPIDAVDNSSVKSAAELATLATIGTTVDSQGQPFAQYATTAGDLFKSAAALPASERLSLWQPSQTFATPTGDAFFIFRLSAMDPSHAPAFDEVRDQVTQDARKLEAWNAAAADADKLLASAKLTSLIAAAQSAKPPLSVITTDFFSMATAADKIPPLPLQPASIRAIQGGAAQLIIKPGPQGHQPVSTVDLPADQEIAIIELNKVRPNWTDPTDRSMRQTELGLEEEMRLAQQVEEGWSIFDAVSKRTQYQESVTK
jgi:hypothetical protein